MHMLTYISRYGSLFAGSPSAPKELVEETTAQEGTHVSSKDPKWFLTRITALLKGDILRKGINGSGPSSLVIRS